MEVRYILIHCSSNAKIAAPTNRSQKMPVPSNTLLIEGSFEELADELALYIDEVKKDGSDLRSRIAPLLERGQKDEALKKLVIGSIILNTAPETGTPFVLFKLWQSCLHLRRRVHSSLQCSYPPCSPITSIG